MKDKLVAIVVENGACSFIANVKAVEQQELNKLKNECEQNKSSKLALESKHVNEHKHLCAKIKSHELFLAKAIYDNFVDKGILEIDKNFEHDWFDFIFNGCELKLDNAPEEFNAILRKVGATHEE